MYVSLDRIILYVQDVERLTKLQGDIRAAEHVSSRCTG
jgi:hypothetical protein